MQEDILKQNLYSASIFLKVFNLTLNKLNILDSNMNIVGNIVIDKDTIIINITTKEYTIEANYKIFIPSDNDCFNIIYFTYKNNNSNISGNFLITNNKDKLIYTCRPSLKIELPNKECITLNILRNNYIFEYISNHNKEIIRINNKDILIFHSIKEQYKELYNYIENINNNKLHINIRRKENGVILKKKDYLILIENIKKILLQSSEIMQKEDNQLYIKINNLIDILNTNNINLLPICYNMYELEDINNIFNIKRKLLKKKD